MSRFFWIFAGSMQYVCRKDNDMKTVIETCGLCGSTKITDLGHGHKDGTVICNDCGAHWWKCWYTESEWEAWVNDQAWANDLEKNSQGET
jgi:hypothetical protein